MNCNLKVLYFQTTFILKRRNRVPTAKQGGDPKPLKARHFIYDLIRDENMQKQSDMEVILTSYVEGLGNIGDKVRVKPYKAYNELLLPGLAVYASPENVDKYKDYDRKEDDIQYSSKTAQIVSIRKTAQLSL